MNAIDIDNIKNIKENKGSISFNDGLEEYSFLLSKNTLTKRFNSSNFLDQIEVEIIKEPLEILANCFSSLTHVENLQAKQTVFLPLYGKGHKVYSNSGLNQWNAKGRKRHQNEVYIPVPIAVHNNYPDFFPDRDTSFNLKLPSGRIIQTKICQDNGKALMSYSNREL